MDTNMICPNCQTQLKEVKVPGASPGFMVKIDQCPNCGGIWCDRYEMYQIPASETIKIDSMNQQLLQSPASLNDNLKCPKDGLPLLAIKDINIPENAQIKRCRQCEGVWLNRGELLNYKKHVQLRQEANAEFNKKLNQKSSPKWSENNDDGKRILAKISQQLMPLPYNFIPTLISPLIGGIDTDHAPFTLSQSAVEIIKQLPQDKKMEIIQIMAREHEQDIESENRFINATATIFNIITGKLMSR